MPQQLGDFIKRRPTLNQPACMGIGAVKDMAFRAISGHLSSDAAPWYQRNHSIIAPALAIVCGVIYVVYRRPI